MRETDRGARLLLALALGPFALFALLWILHAESGEGSGGISSVIAVVARTLVVAGSGAALATVVGGALGVLVSAYRIPARGLWTPLLLAPFLLPSVVVTTAAQSWLAGGSLVVLVRGEVGAALLHAVQLAPLVLWGVARSLAAVPRAERLAMRSQLSPGRAARLLAARAAPVALRLGSLSFLLLLPRIEIPAYTGVETIGPRALAAFTASGSDLEGWLWCTVCLGIAAPLLRFATATIALEAAPASLGRPDPLAPRSVVATAIAFVPALLAMLGLGGLCDDALEEGFALAQSEASRWIAALGLDILRVVPLSLALALVGWRIGIGVGRVGTALAALPLVLPGCLPALILLEGGLPRLPAWIADGTIPLDFAQGVRFLGVAVLLGRIADRTIPRAERDAASLLSPMTRRFRVLLPRAVGGITASATILVVLILGEVESASLVVPPGRLLPAVELHQLLHYRYDVQAARLSLALAAAAGILVAVIGRVGRGAKGAG